MIAYLDASALRVKLGIGGIVAFATFDHTLAVAAAAEGLQFVGA